MADIQAIYNEYGSRIHNPECYTAISNAVQMGLSNEVRRYGIHEIQRVAHGVVAFCVDQSSPVCLPWLIAPDAPSRDLIGGRHGFVYEEFFKVADEARIGSFQSRGYDVSYDDLVGTYVIDNPQNETPYTVICDDLDRSKVMTSEQIELLEKLTARYTDHQIVTRHKTGEDDTFLKIKGGTTKEVPYGRIRSLQVPTLALAGDILGMTRELDNYAAYAQKHGLDQFEFLELAYKAVDAFGNGQRVSLDELCEGIIASREIEAL